MSVRRQVGSAHSANTGTNALKRFSPRYTRAYPRAMRELRRPREGREGSGLIAPASAAEIPPTSRTLEPRLFELPPGVRIVHLYADPINMRWGDMKLVALCREDMGIDPDHGAVFLFHNRKKDQIRLFFLDEDGAQMLTKFLPDNAFLLPVVPKGDRSMEVPVSLLGALFKQP